MDAVFSRWTALLLATEQGNRPFSEAQAIVETLRQTILQSAVEGDLCEELLETLFDEMFDILDVDVEDGSVEEVSRLLCQLASDSKEGKLERIQPLLAANRQPAHVSDSYMDVSSTLQVEEKDAERERTTHPTRMMDEEGFIPVLRRGRRRG
eukprot:jgi/Galph1/4316/GphlegSOOS_G3020.1